MERFKDDTSEVQSLARWLILVSGGEAMVGTLQGRMRVATEYGYMDARTMVFLKETKGYPLADCAIKVQQKGLNIDFAGLRHELLRIGKNESAVEAELQEVAFFVDCSRGLPGLPGGLDG